MTAKRTKQQRIVHYKQATFTNSQQTLEQALKAAWAAKQSNGDRRQPMSAAADEKVWLLIGDAQQETNFFHGLLTRFTPGMNPLFVVDDEASTALRMTQLSGGQDPTSGKNRELLEGVLCFSVTGNHLVVLQSSHLRTAQLEQHLVWLLRQTGLLTADQGLELVDRPPKAIADRLAAKPLKAVVFGSEVQPVPDGEVEAAPVDALAEATTTTATGEVNMRSPDTDTALLSFLKKLIEPEARDKFNFDDLAESRIKFSLRLTYDRKTDRAGHDVLKLLGSTLRHAEGLSTELELEGGGKIKGTEMRVQSPITLDLYDGVPQHTEVYALLKAWLLKQLQTGNLQA